MVSRIVGKAGLALVLAPVLIFLVLLQTSPAKALDCQRPLARDVLFLLDSSDTMDPARYYSDMLDFLIQIYTALPGRTRGGVITFGGTVELQVPVESYSNPQWIDKVEEIRANPKSCCSCCTPLAEAFKLARLTLKGLPEDAENPTLSQLVVTITDGAVFQIGKKREGFWHWPKYSAAKYRYQIVPSEAMQLKNMNPDRPVRIIVIGVPTKTGSRFPNDDYFSTKMKKDRLCVARAGVRACAKVPHHLYPIASVPAEKNLFIADTWNVSSMIDTTLPDLCDILTTSSPTLPTTRSPTHYPTKVGATAKPSVASPTFAPTNPTAQPSTLQPTKQPVAQPTPQPTLTNPPSFGAGEDTFAPTLPSGGSTKAPTLAPTSQLTKSPTPAPGPTLTPSRAPTQIEVFNGLDVIVYMDRSRSMIWRSSICRTAPGSNPDAPDNRVCWELFVNFVKAFVEKTANLHYQGHPSFGWQSEWGANSTRGIRVSVYAFACIENQKVPVVDIIGEGISDPEAFERAMEQARSLTPQGGTCPGAALERSVAMVAKDVLHRPHKVGLLMTDGVFYDAPRPVAASRGLAHYNVLTYALGIAIPKQDESNGLTKSEITLQRQQLRAFTNNKKDRVLNFGEEGFHLLDSIANSIIERLPSDVEDGLPTTIDKPYWCGWTSGSRCTNMDPATYASGEYCKWIPNKPNKPQSGGGKCVEKKWCKYKTKALCNADPMCKFQNQTCRKVKITDAPVGE